MRFPRTSKVGMLGLGLAITTVAMGQNADVPPQVVPSNTGPIRSPAAPSASSVGASSGDDASTGADRTASASQRATSTPGGYTWSSKTTKPKTGKKRPTLDPKRPLVQAPNFQIGADGTSVVSLIISQTTLVTERVVGRRIEYSLKGAQVGVDNNLNPLITDHFATPLVRVVLRRHKDGIVLVLELREIAQPTYQMRNGPAGSSTLEVKLPKPSQIQPQPRSSGKSASSDRRSSLRDRHQEGSEPAGPGPRL